MLKKIKINWSKICSQCDDGNLTPVPILSPRWLWIKLETDDISTIIDLSIFPPNVFKLFHIRNLLALSYQIKEDENIFSKGES